MDMDLFQILIWSVHVIFVCLWIISSIIVLYQEYYYWHILPSSGYFAYLGYLSGYEQMAQQIHGEYEEMVVHPFIHEILYGVFGSDITNIIFMHLKNMRIDSETIIIENLLDDAFGIEIASVILDFVVEC